MDNCLHTVDLQAITRMKDQPAGGHVFNMDGAGADGNATPRFAAYGATKRSLQQVSCTAPQPSSSTTPGYHILQSPQVVQLPVMNTRSLVNYGQSRLEYKRRTMATALVLWRLLGTFV